MNTTSDPTTAPALVHNPQDHTLSIHSLPVPTPIGPDEHLLVVQAVALTNGELSWPEPAAVSPYSVPGYEVSGTVVSAPLDSPFRPGTAVYARTAFERPGSARVYSIARTAELGRKPDNISWEAAATVPLSALTAWQALFDHGGLLAPADEPSSASQNRSKRILITAAAGGVGLWAVQLAKLAGAGCVIGTCGPANIDFVQGLGADEVVDYTVVPDLGQWIGGKERFDLVLDCVGGRTLEQAWLCVKDSGMLISIVQPPEIKRPQSGVSNAIRSKFFIVKANGKQLERITTLIELGKCRTFVDSVFALEEFQQAFQKVHGGHVRGKVVLSIAT